MSFQTIYVPGLSTNVVVVDPASLGAGSTNPTTPIVPVESGTWPSPPPIPFNWSAGAQYEMLGDDTDGDCQVVAGVHADECMTYSSLGVQSQFTEAAVLADYFSVTGGQDIGWNYFNLFAQWEQAGPGLGGNPSAKIWDYMSIDFTDSSTIQAAMAFFGPLIWNGYLAPSWVSKFKPGYVWDISPGITPVNYLAHAVMIFGVTSDGTLWMATWGSEGYMTMAAVDAATFFMGVTFGPRWFNPSGYAPNGLHYTYLMPLWLQLGGNPGLMPSVSPYPPPVPTPPSPPSPPVPPTPPPAFTADLCLFSSAKQVHINTSGWSMKDNIPAASGKIVKFNYGAHVVHGPKGWTQTANASGWDVGISLGTNQIHAPGWSFIPNGSPGVITARCNSKGGSMPAGWIQI